jgi:ADP-heptose:LPS heptosyltransferase
MNIAPRILIIRFSSIGDIVLTSPVIRCIRKKYPEAFIGFATKKKFSFLAEENPYIDKVYGLDTHFSSFKEEIRQDRFDYIIDLHHNLRTKRLCLGMNARVYRFRKLNPEKWLLVKFRVNLLPAEHIVDRYLRAAKKLGVSNDGAGLDYFIPGNTPPMPVYPVNFLALAIGGQHYTKKLPVEALVLLCNMIKFPVVILGGEEDGPAGKEIVRSSHNSQITDYTGKLSLHQSAEIVRRSAALCTHDTGMMHIGAALDIPVVSVWGNTVPEFGMTPYFPQASASARLSEIFEVKNLSCRPCSKIGFDQCPKGHFKCMNNQDISTIAARLNGILSLEKATKAQRS